MHLPRLVDRKGFDFGTGINEDTILFAKWEKENDTAKDTEKGSEPVKKSSRDTLILIAIIIVLAVLEAVTLTVMLVNKKKNAAGK